MFFRSEEDPEAPPETLLLNKLVAGVTMELQVQMVSLAEQFTGLFIEALELCGTRRLEWWTCC